MWNFQGIVSLLLFYMSTNKYGDFEIWISVPLIKYNLRIISLGKSFTKCGGEAIHRPFFKKTKVSISLAQ